MPSKNLSFRTPLLLMEQIQSRDVKGVENPGAIAKRDLGRWYTVLQEAMSEVRLSPAEAVVLIHYVDAFKGHPLHSNVLMAAQVIESGPMGLGDLFTGVRMSLAAKMASWSLAGKYAAWDAAERYQVAFLRNEAGPLTLTFGMALHHVGLHTYDLPKDELATIERMKAVPAELLPDAYVLALEDVGRGTES